MAPGSLFVCLSSDWSERSFTSRVKGRLALSKENGSGGGGVYKRKFKDYDERVGKEASV